MKKFWILILIVIFSFQLNCQDLIESNKIVSSDRGYYESYGISVSICGNFLIVGAHRDDEGIENNDDVLEDAGSAFIYMKNELCEWNQIQKIVASDRQAGDSFGHAVSITRDYAIVGAQKESHDPNGGGGMNAAGSAYIFKRNDSNNWDQTQKITASDRDSGDEFGWSVSIKDNHAIIGARSDNEDELGENFMANSGAAYIFYRDTLGIWHEKQKIVALDRDAHDLFGWSVSTDSNTAIVGALYDYEDANGNDSIYDAGAAYLFEQNNEGIWIQKQKIVASDRDIGDYFGDDVAIDGRYSVVGARLEDENSSGLGTLENSGSAYLFMKSDSGNWIQTQKIVATDREEGANFGTSVSIDSNILLIGALADSYDETGNNFKFSAGSAYLFRRGDSELWYQAQKIVASDRSDFDEFGFSVSLEKNTCVVGAIRESNDINGEDYLYNSGSAYIFETSTTDISADEYRNTIFVFPNPTYGNINLRLGFMHEELDLEVRSILGRVIYSSNYKLTDFINFKISGTSGLYFIRITNKVNNNTTNIKIIKK